MVFLVDFEMNVPKNSPQWEVPGAKQPTPPQLQVNSLIRGIWYGFGSEPIRQKSRACIAPTAKPNRVTWLAPQRAATGCTSRIFPLEPYRQRPGAHPPVHPMSTELPAPRLSTSVPSEGPPRSTARFRRDRHRAPPYPAADPPYIHRAEISDVVDASSISSFVTARRCSPAGRFPGPLTSRSGGRSLTPQRDCRSP